MTRYVLIHEERCLGVFDSDLMALGKAVSYIGKHYPRESIRPPRILPNGYGIDLSTDTHAFHILFASEVR